MRSLGDPAAISDRSLRRLVIGLALILLLGIPAFGAFYYFDRHPDPGPSLADRAIAAAEGAVRSNPADLDARNALAAAYVRAKRFTECISQFGEVLKVAPRNRAALLGRGLAYRQSGQAERALADFESLVDLAASGEMAGVDPQLEQAYYEIGSIELERGRSEAAIAALEQALRIDAGDADALFAYGTALVRIGNAQQGVDALRRAVAFVPAGWCDPYRGLIDGYRALGDRDGAAYADGMVAACEGRLDEATQKLDVLQSGSHAIDAWLGLALVEAAEGAPANAAAYYRRVLAREPDNPSALIGLAQIGTPDLGAARPGPSVGGS